VVPRRILERIRDHLSPEPPTARPGEAAVYYALRTGGEVGVISPVSCRFCDLCNRLRLTADGKLRPCLTGEGEVDVWAPCARMWSRRRFASCFQAAVAGRRERVPTRLNESRPHGPWPRSGAERARVARC